MQTSRYKLYEIKFANGKRYVGISNNVRRRLRGHIKSANNGDKLPIYAALRKYNDYAFRVLCVGSRLYIAELEIKFISIYCLQNRAFGYNVAMGGDTGRFGLKHSEASKLKMANAIRPKRSRESIERGAEKLRGIKRGPFSPEHIEKLKMAIRPKCTEQQRINISNRLRIAYMEGRGPSRKGKPAWNKGMPNSGASVWITDGIKNSRIKANGSIPDGWFLGRTFSQITIKKLANAARRQAADKI